MGAAAVKSARDAESASNRNSVRDSVHSFHDELASNDSTNLNPGRKTPTDSNSGRNKNKKMKSLEIPPNGTERREIPKDVQMDMYVETINSDRSTESPRNDSKQIDRKVDVTEGGANPPHGRKPSSSLKLAEDITKGTFKLLHSPDFLNFSVLDLSSNKDDISEGIIGRRKVPPLPMQNIPGVGQTVSSGAPSYALSSAALMPRSTDASRALVDLQRQKVLNTIQNAQVPPLLRNI